MTTHEDEQLRLQLTKSLRDQMGPRRTYQEHGFDDLELDPREPRSFRTQYPESHTTLAVLAVHLVEYHGLWAIMTSDREAKLAAVQWFDDEATAKAAWLLGCTP